MAFGAALGAFPILRLSRRIRACGLALLAAVVFLAPILVPLPYTALRLVASLGSITVGVKLYDLFWAVETGPPPRMWEFLTYLPNICDLVLRQHGARKHRARGTDVLRLCGLIPVTLVCGVIAIAAWRFDWRAVHWMIQYCVKVIAVCAVIQFGSNIIASSWRLIGVPAMDFSGWFFAAATPAEFWRRWNRPAGEFLHRYVYLPAGGRRHSARAVMATFAVNGVLHEYVADIAAGRVLGYAVVFFLLQGAATAATMRLRPRGWPRLLGIALTLAFNLATGLLFVAGVNAVLPFYSTN